jgi:hypothetical protein
MSAKNSPPTPPRGPNDRDSGSNTDSAPQATGTRELILAYFQEPERWQHIASTATPIPDDFSVVLAHVSAQLGSYRGAFKTRVLSDEEKQTADLLARAMQRYIVKVLACANADHYRVLGLTRRASATDIHQHHQMLRRVLDIGDETPSIRRAVEFISRAYATLTDSQRRATYDKTLR